MRAPLVSLLIVSLPFAGCATKRYVSREVGEIDGKVDGLSSSIESTQDRVRANEARLDQVNEQSQAGISDARSRAEQAMSTASEAEKASKGKLVYAVTLSDDKVTFPFNKAELGEDAQKVVADTVSPLVAQNRGVYLEIEGHTDSTGTKEFNKALGEQRASAVREYLHDREGIALNRMEVISYGDAEPVVDNATPEHRAQNRRVVIKVLE
jgi:peptidoglycan-associated lipoprotein